METDELETDDDGDQRAVANAQAGDQRSDVRRQMTSDRYGLLFELSKDAVTEVEIIDGVPIVSAVNPAFVEVFGYDREVIVGESLNGHTTSRTQPLD